MASVQPPERRTTPPVETTVSESPIAVQVQTKETLLEKVSSRTTWQHIPILRWIEAKYYRGQVKKEYMATLKTQFLQAGRSRGLDPEKVTAFFEDYLEPHLMKLHLEDLPHIEAFWSSPGGIDAFLLTPRAGIKTLSQLIPLTVAAMKRDPEGTIGLLGASNRILTMMDRRFTAFDRMQFLQRFLTMASSPEARDFLGKLNLFLDSAEKIQAERPKIYDALDKEDFLSRGADLLEAYPQFENTIKEIQDMTVVMNTQVVHENIKMFFDPIGVKRGLPSLDERYDYPQTTSREKRFPFQLLEDSHETMNFYAETDVLITNQKTMETRSLRVPLPFKGWMSKTEARQLLKLLNAVIWNPKPETFDQAYEKLGLNPELKAERKEVFLEWDKRMHDEYGHCIFDFNPTPTRPRMAFALESEAVKRALEKPGDRSAAIEVACQRNLYRAEGRLSLLPEGLAERHRTIAMLDPQELYQSSELLLGRRKRDVPLQVMPGSTVDLSFKIEAANIDGHKGIYLHTDFKGMTPHRRTTLYMLGPKQNTSDKLEEIVRSGLFERDLLLAKAEFLEKYG